MTLDMIGRQIQPGDYVVCFNHIYSVLEVPESKTPYSYVRIMLASRSKTTRPVRKYSKEMCVLPTTDVLNYLNRE